MLKHICFVTFLVLLSAAAGCGHHPGANVQDDAHLPDPIRVASTELRVLKNVELAPAGRVRGSAFLPAVANARELVLAYAQGGRVTRIQFPGPFKTSS
jgi:hypothetical protein